MANAYRMTKCLYCGKENADDSARCQGCGTMLKPDSGASDLSPSSEFQGPRVAKRQRMMNSGALWFFGGTAATLLSYMSAVNSPYGGHYVIAWGAMAYGAVKFIQGLAAGNARVADNNDARDLLDLAARLEGPDRAKALLTYKDIVKRFPGTRASEEAQRNIKALTSRN